MPLHALQAPVPAERCVRAALRSEATELPGPPGGGDGPAGAVLSLPTHQLAPVTAREEEPHTTLTGWRFLIPAQDGRPAGAADAGLTAEGWVFAGFRTGPYIEATERALHQAATLVTDYQPRLLSVPQLYMMTLWLHTGITSPPEPGGPGGDDVLVPLAPAPPGIAPHLPLGMRGLLELLSSRLAPEPLAG